MDSGKRENANAGPEGGFLQLLTPASDWLQHQNKTRLAFDRHHEYMRYVDLRVTDIFNALVTLYTSVFRTYWVFLRHIICNTNVKVPTGHEPQYLARAYISAWIHDLYAANRRAAFHVCPMACIEYYNMDRPSCFSNYEVYLTLLQATIRPTPVLLTHEETLFVPRFGPIFDRDALDKNFFNIEGWHLDNILIHNMHNICRYRKLMKFEPIVEAGFGRVSWLFDWHHTNRAYAWFPVEGNYDMRDVAVAYILGVECTPKLGPRDRDEWQQFPGNVVPPKVNVTDYKRMTPVTYHGAVEVDTIEVDRYQIPEGYLDQVVVTQCRAAQPPPAEGPSQPVQRPQKRTRGPRTISTTSQQDGVIDISTNNDNEVPFDVSVMSNDEVVPGEASHLVNRVPLDHQETVDITKEVGVHAHSFNRYRITTYIYFNDVTDCDNQDSRFAALHMAIAP